MFSGSSWILGKLSLFLPQNMRYFSLLLECLDCCSGIAIFYVLICSRPRIKKLLANRRILGIFMPSDWSRLSQSD